jgi:hypothetical protein
LEEGETVLEIIGIFKTIGSERFGSSRARKVSGNRQQKAVGVVDDCVGLTGFAVVPMLGEWSQ